MLLKWLDFKSINQTVDFLLTPTGLSPETVKWFTSMRQSKKIIKSFSKLE